MFGIAFQKIGASTRKMGKAQDAMKAKYRTSLTVSFGIVEAEECDCDEGAADSLLPLRALLPVLQNAVHLGYISSKFPR